MLILTLRTDKPDAEIGLYERSQKLAYETWPAHRELAETIHRRLKDVLDKQGKELGDIEAIVIFKGPGSFTGLRIGVSVGNALAAALKLPIVTEAGESWVDQGVAALMSGRDDRVAVPDYGAAARTTQQKK